MADIVDLQEHKPHLTGPAKCHQCGFKWQAVAPIPAPSGFECPECGSFFGFFIYPIEENDGLERFSCAHCKGQIFNVLRGSIRCVNCGLLTDINELIESD